LQYVGMYFTTFTSDITIKEKFRSILLTSLEISTEIEDLVAIRGNSSYEMSYPFLYIVTTPLPERRKLIQAIKVTNNNHPIKIITKTKLSNRKNQIRNN
jgi:hypothetical protein